MKDERGTMRSNEGTGKDGGGWTMRNGERAMKDGRGCSRTYGGGTDSPAADGWFARRVA